MAEKAIRKQIEHLYGPKSAESIQILYGGSVTADSVADYLAIPGIDGILVGAASLEAHVFSKIVEKAHKGSSEGEED